MDLIRTKLDDRAVGKFFRLAVFGMLVLLFAVCLSACGVASASTRFTVNLTDIARYDPASLSVPKGATVTWINRGNTPHTVTADPAKANNKRDVALPSGATPWDSGEIYPGETWSYTFTVPGRYVYFSMLDENQGMLGTIVVTQ